MAPVFEKLFAGRIRQAFGANFERLQEVKDHYDPENVFHSNQNIPPSGS